MSGGRYIGRFAPSPTGPLHFGSLVAALGSYLQAKAHNGKWLLRIEDIDPPREVPGSADAILRALEAFGLGWDGAVLYQSTRLRDYAAVVERLLQDGYAYRCRCTRRQVAANRGGLYTGRCRHAGVSATEDHSVRILTAHRTIRFHDGLQGAQEQDFDSEVGDYIIQRRDGLFAYQLAVTLDDAYQGVTEVVRGFDLLSSTARQIHLRKVLELPEPAFVHLPLALDETGQKLSKQSGAAALNLHDRSETMFDALTTLGQAPPVQLRLAPVSEQLSWARKNWNISKLQGISAVELDKDRRILTTLRHPAALQNLIPK